MDPARLVRRGECEWELVPSGTMRVPAVVYASDSLVRSMDDKVFEQASNVALSDRRCRLSTPIAAASSRPAPGACKDVDEVVDAAAAAGLARKVAWLEPMVCVKG